MKRRNQHLAIFLLVLLLPTLIFSQSFKFAAMSDSRGPYNGVNEPVLSALANHLAENHPDIKFVIFPGDMVNGNRENPNQTMRELNHWKEVMAPVYNLPGAIEPKIFVTPGNHEIQHRMDEANFKKVFSGMPQNGPDDEKGLTFSFDYNNNHFILVNTARWNYGDPNDTTDDKDDWHRIEHIDWLENDLKEARERGVDNIFVAGHDMPFPTGGHIRDGFARLFDLDTVLTERQKAGIKHRDDIWNLFKKYDVAAYMCGHEHLYSRLQYQGVYQLILGSCGAPIYYHNSKYGDNPEKKRPGQTMTYNESVPYYEVLGYSHGPGKSSQISEDFFGLRVFHYSVFEVQPEGIKVTTYGIPLKEGTRNKPDGEVREVDSFIIK